MIAARKIRGPDFGAHSDVVLVTAGAGVNGSPQKVLVDSVVPSGGRIWLDAIIVRIVDLSAYDQLKFSLRLNGARIIPWHALSGERFFDSYRMPIGREFGPGLLEVAATNISGTTETGNMQPGVDIRVVAGFAGSLLN